MGKMKLIILNFIYEPQSLSISFHKSSNNIPMCLWFEDPLMSLWYIFGTLSVWRLDANDTFIRILLADLRVLLFSSSSCKMGTKSSLRHGNGFDTWTVSPSDSASVSDDMYSSFNASNTSCRFSSVHVIFLRAASTRVLSFWKTNQYCQIYHVHVIWLPKYKW